jgi:hypothetical protein
MDNDVVLVEDKIEYDLDDLILFEVGESVRSLANMFGPRKIKIGMLEVDMPVENPNASFEDRLHDVFTLAELCLWNTPNASVALLSNITESILRQDGWHIGNHSFRTPLWMFDHKELSIKEASKITGLEWLKDSI